MTCLLDMNVPSELRKGSRCNVDVATRFSGVADEALCLSVLVVGEIRRGIEAVRRRDPGRAGTLERWLARLKPGSTQTGFFLSIEPSRRSGGGSARFAPCRSSTCGSPRPPASMG